MNVMNVSNRVLAFERTFDAPRELVFAMWTNPKHMIRWYGPRGHSLTSCELDVRVGGGWRACMFNGEGETWVWGTYHEIMAPSKLVFSSSMHWHRYETLVTIDFDDAGDGRTRMRFRQEEFRNTPDCEDHAWGWASALDKLTEQLALMHTGGIYKDLLWKEPRINGVAADFEAAAERARHERDTMPDKVVPPSVRSSIT